MSTRINNQLFKKTSARSGANTTALPSDTSEAPNVVTSAATRTRASRCAASNSTTPAENGTQIENIVTGSDQCHAPQAAHPVAPQLNYDDNDGDDDDDILPQNLNEMAFKMLPIAIILILTRNILMKYSVTS